MSRLFRQFWDLGWADVDPGAHPLTAGQKDALRDRLQRQMFALKAEDTGQGDWRQRGLERIDGAIIEICGRWALGWQFTVGEGSCGGVVRAWCCAGHSFFPQGYKKDLVGTVVAKIMRALDEWRAYLDVLEALFAARQVPADAVDRELVVMETCGHLLTLVVERTGCEDAWYGHAQQVMAWYFESLGLPSKKARRASHTVLSGRFESWCTPSEEVQAACAAELAAAVVDRL